MNLAADLAGVAAISGVAAVAVRGMPLPYVARAVAAVSAPPPARRDRRAGPTPVDELPLLLDLLATATSAGMSGAMAFEAAATALRGPLGASLRAVAAGSSLGRPFTDGMREVADRLGLPELLRAATILGRSGSLGVPVSVALRDLAAEHRRARRRAAEQRARTAPVRMLFPLVFLVLPAFLLLTVVPMLLATLGSLS